MRQDAAMAEELLERVLREIRDRRVAAWAAREESQRLEQALVALGPPRERSGSRAGGRSRRPGSKPRRRRAAPGANRTAIVALVRDRPGATAAEIAEATKIGRSTVTTTLGRLIDAEDVQRVELPGGRTGFSIHEAQPENAAISESAEPEIAEPVPEATPASD